ncbi:MAG TPA: hypothetical protein VLI69_00500 [Gammaproteobacteria bacterium]|nr:hypothetical protein [Gammaproteobacteria bacterium]
MRARLFSKTPLLYPFQLSVINHPQHIIDTLRKSKFTLADHFLGTLNKNEEHEWRKTYHQLLLAETKLKPIAFAGIEVGDGEIIQRYLGENEEQILHNKTCFLHAMEICPEHRGSVLQMLLWKKICEQALLDKMHSIIWEPIHEDACKRFFARFNVVPVSHQFVQMSFQGDFFDGEDSIQRRYSENIITIFQIQQTDLLPFHKKLTDVIKKQKISENMSMRMSVASENENIMQFKTQQPV